MSEEKAGYHGKDAAPITDKDGIIRLPKPEESPKPPEPDFQAHFDDTFVLTMRIDLKACVSDQDKYHMLRGFFDNTRDSSLMHVHGLRKALAEQQSKINGFKNGHKPGFMDGLHNFLKRK